jgi:hypothetical protein
MSMSHDPAERAIVAAHRAGSSVQEIADSTGCTPMLVRTVLGEVGVLGRRRGRVWPYDAATEEVIARAYGQGVTMAQLIRAHGGSNRTIRHVLDHKGVPVRNRGRRPKAAQPSQAQAPQPCTTGT